MILRVFDLIVLVAFFATMPLVIVFNYQINYYWDFVSNLFQNDESTEVYDFIVVGAGSSGAVIANRLSKNNKVLLLEAGGNPLYYNSISGLALQMLNRPEVDWLHKTVPQKHSSQGLMDKVSRWPRGKLLGGTSNLNYMLYVRGSPVDYNNWANITGDDEWKYDNLLYYFKRGLNYNGKFQDNDKYYGKSAYGRLHVEARDWGPLHSTFVEAGKELGLQELDLNAPQRSGISRFEVSQKQGKRFGTFFAFLKDIQDRDNLRISRYSQATKIKLDKNNRAVGVWYIRNGKKKFAHSSKEVIVSSGSIDSPKLLMLSGIGPKSHLTANKIKPKVDLPVGQSLYDHLASLIMPVTIEKQLSLIPERDFGISTFYDYYVNGKGPLTSPTGFHSQAFFCSSVSACEKGKDWPDVQLYLSSAGVYENLAADLSTAFGIDFEDLNSHLKPDVGKDGFILMPTLLLPKSVGEITLRDKNPMSPPLIDPHYLEHPDDVRVLVDGCKMATKFVEETKAFKKLNAKLSGKNYPGCEMHKFKSDLYWECYVRRWAMTLFHPVGTCRMGKGITDKKAVVDSKLRVLKTIALRVADASIMPQIVSGNTNAPSIMIGEKASDIIREFWSQQFLICDLIERLQGIDTSKRCYYSKLP